MRLLGSWEVWLREIRGRVKLVIGLSLFRRGEKYMFIPQSQDLYLIGNGFDLYLGLKTSYKDFFKKIY